MDPAQTKEAEKEYHDRLYKNVSLLTMVIPPTKQFKEVFSKTMFVKNNKVAFQQVVHYLLHCFDPRVAEEKFPFWPLLDKQMETLFRTAVVKYINEIISTHEDSGLQMLMPSQLINPGGYKVVKFMFHLSQFVLYHHLKADGIEVLPPLRPSKNEAHTNKLIEKYKLVTTKLNDECSTGMNEYADTFESYKTEAKHITEGMTSVKNSLPKLKKLLDNFESQTSNPENIGEGVKEIQNKIRKISATAESLQRSAELVGYLGGEESHLEFTGASIPAEISQVIHPEWASLSLTKLLQGFLVFMESKMFKINFAHFKNMTERVNSVTELNKSLLDLSREFRSLTNEYSALLINLKTFNSRQVDPPFAIPEIILEEYDSLDSMLAIPLQNSPEDSAKMNC